MDTIIIAVVSVTAISAVCAVILCAASKFMAVKSDERMVKIRECLPGTNCGACGFPGCDGYAAALISGGDVKTNLCAPGGAAVLEQLSGILGVDAGDPAVKTAVVRCGGGDLQQKKKMDYKGIETCMAAKQLFGGEGMCAFGCLGYGDCQAACPGGAICMENKLARVIPGLCTGCGLCVKACPNNLITVDDESIAVAVLCKNMEKGAVVRKKCSSGCIGCKKCVRECEAGAIAVENNLAVIDYEKCTGCGHCAGVCVTKSIKLLAHKDYKI
ncbi:MAG: RnfABCDGE type electron transport complex subunit B [Oscillospiraceae bacterium]|nr:RnfABCDGE type electron transport complex subunit B [Oscillospiraceae bacterium]